MRVLLLILILCSIELPAQAQEPQPASQAAVSGTGSPSQTAAAQNNTSADTAIKGAVRTFELNLELLKEIGLDIKNVIKSAASLYDEVSIQPVSMVKQPELIGRGMVIYIPVATQVTGPPLPPRKARLDRAMNEIVPVVSMLKRDVDDVREGRLEIAVSDEARERLRPLFRTWGSIVDQINTRMSALQQLTAGPTYNNRAIGAWSKALQSDAQALEDTRRRIYKILQKEGKRSKS